MAEKRMSFPKMIISNWWELRKVAKDTPEINLNPKKIAEILGITPATVYANVYPALRQFELINKKGELTERGKRWLNDNDYKDVCTDILENIYPIELLNSIDDPVNNRNAVKDWFQRKTNTNINSILQMTATYILLYKADLNEAYYKNESKISSSLPKTEEKKNGNPALEEKPALANFETEKISGQEVMDVNIPAQDIEVPFSAKIKPAININIQFVITQDTPVEQIDILFSSMAKHLLVK